MMKYTKKIILALLIYTAALAAGITAAARAETITHSVTGTVDPVNAVLAAALVLLAGGVIFIRRHR